MCQSQPFKAGYAIPVLGKGLFETKLCAIRITTMVRSFPLGVKYFESGNAAARTSDETMNTRTSFLSTKQALTQAEINTFIAQAYQMRPAHLQPDQDQHPIPQGVRKSDVAPVQNFRLSLL